MTRWIFTIPFAWPEQCMSMPFRVVVGVCTMPIRFFVRIYVAFFVLFLVTFGATACLMIVLYMGWIVMIIVAAMTAAAWLVKAVKVF